MDKLCAEQRADIKKFSVAKLVVKLVKAGNTEEEIEGLDKSKLMDLWAECLLAVKDIPGATEAISSNIELEKMRLQIEAQIEMMRL